jgi:hypothetical protein
MYIVITNIDAYTKIICTEEPMKTGPALPDLKGFQYIFSNESTYPIGLKENGAYGTTPLYYGTCDEDADTTLTGVLYTLTESDFNSARETEHLARKPYPSWIGNLATMSWNPPADYPQDGKQYYWDEPSASWKEQTPVVQLP